MHFDPNTGGYVSDPWIMTSHERDMYNAKSIATYWMNKYVREQDDWQQRLGEHVSFRINNGSLFVDLAKTDKLPNSESFGVHHLNLDSEGQLDTIIYSWGNGNTERMNPNEETLEKKMPDMYKRVYRRPFGEEILRVCQILVVYNILKISNDLWNAAVMKYTDPSSYLRSGGNGYVKDTISSI